MCRTRDSALAELCGEIRFDAAVQDVVFGGDDFGGPDESPIDSIQFYREADRRDRAGPLLVAGRATLPFKKTFDTLDERLGLRA